MNEFEANALLTAAALVDPRSKPNADRAEEWAKRLPEVSFEDGLHALHEHQRTSDEPILPVHVLRILAAEHASGDVDVTDLVIADSKARILAAAGVTEAEYEAHATDLEWLRQKFPPRSPANEITDENGDPE